MTTPLRSAGWHRLLTTTVSTPTLSYSTVGQVLLSTLWTGAGAGTTGAEMIYVQGGPGKSPLAFEFKPICADTGIAMTYNIWRVTGLQPNNGKDITRVYTDCLYSGTATSGSVTGMSGSTLNDNVVLPTEYFPTTMTVTPSTAATTPKGPGTFLETQYQSPGAACYSGSADGSAFLHIPDLLDCEALFIQISAATAEGTNAIYRWAPPVSARRNPER